MKPRPGPRGAAFPARTPSPRREESAGPAFTASPGPALCSAQKRPSWLLPPKPGPRRGPCQGYPSPPLTSFGIAPQMFFLPPQRGLFPPATHTHTHTLNVLGLTLAKARKEPGPYSPHYKALGPPNPAPEGDTGISCAPAPGRVQVFHHHQDPQCLQSDVLIRMFCSFQAVSPNLSQLQAQLWAHLGLCPL